MTTNVYDEFPHTADDGIEATAELVWAELEYMNSVSEAYSYAVIHGMDADILDGKRKGAVEAIATTLFSLTVQKGLDHEEKHQSFPKSGLDDAVEAAVVRVFEPQIVVDGAQEALDWLKDAILAAELGLKPRLIPVSEMSPLVAYGHALQVGRGKSPEDLAAVLDEAAVGDDTTATNRSGMVRSAIIELAVEGTITNELKQNLLSPWEQQ